MLGNTRRIELPYDHIMMTTGHLRSRCWSEVQEAAAEETECWEAAKAPREAVKRSPREGTGMLEAAARYPQVWDLHRRAAGAGGAADRCWCCRRVRPEEEGTGHRAKGMSGAGMLRYGRPGEVTCWLGVEKRPWLVPMQWQVVVMRGERRLGEGWAETDQRAVEGKGGSTTRCRRVAARSQGRRRVEGRGERAGVTGKPRVARHQACALVGTAARQEEVTGRRVVGTGCREVERRQ